MNKIFLVLFAASALTLACDANVVTQFFPTRFQPETQQAEPPAPIAALPTSAPTAPLAPKPTAASPSPSISIKGAIDVCKFFTKTDAEMLIGEPVKSESTSETGDDFAYCGYHAVNPGILRGAHVLVFQGDAAKAEFLQSIKDLQGGGCGAGFSTGKSDAPDDVAAVFGRKTLKELADVETKLFKEKCGASDYGFQLVTGIGDVAEFKAWRNGALLDVVSGNALFRLVVSKENPDRAKALEAEKNLARKLLAQLRVSVSENSQFPLPPSASSAASIRSVEISDSSHARLKHPSSLFDSLAMPFVIEAQRVREERRATDPQFAKRIDKELNENRVNFLLFGYGETHEPPVTEKAIIGSTTIVSYNFKTKSAEILSLTHDIRAPEIEQALNKRGQKTWPIRMDQAYFVGGFPLMREVLEDATGLAIDFQVVFKDAAIRDLIDQVFGEIEIASPSEFEVQPFYLDGKKYPAGIFPKGRQTLNGIRVIQFIKTVPVADGAYAKSLEHNARKHIIFQALLESIQRNHSDRGFWLKSSVFFAQALAARSIAYDFDPIPLMLHNLGNISSALSERIAREKAAGVHIPTIKKTLYIVDPAHGDGGVQWVNANARVNPITKRDVEKGVYPSLDLAIPLNANPYGDLVTQYWTSVRALVKKSLYEKAP